MRMWMLDPSKMCNKHLVGEHGEIHKFRHNFVKRHNMSKRQLLNQIEPYAMADRHEALAKEMLKRGMNHKSPYILPDVTYLEPNKVDIEASLLDLIIRCEKCKELNDEKI